MRDSLAFSALQFLLRFDVSFFDHWYRNSVHNSHKKKLLRLLSLENIVVGSIIIQDETVCKAYKRQIPSGSSPESKRRKADSSSSFSTVNKSTPTFADFTASTSFLSDRVPIFRDRQSSDGVESESSESHGPPSSLDVESGTQCNCVSSSDNKQCSKMRCKDAVLDLAHYESFSRLKVFESDRASSEEGDYKVQENQNQLSEST